MNINNDILYDYVIPKLFSQIYAVKYVQNEPEPITKDIVKEPPYNDNDGSGPYFEFQFDDEHFISELDEHYMEYNQSESGNQKSFNLSGYGFDSSPERSFFDENLFKNDDIKHIWFTGMLTHGQSEFYIHYREGWINEALAGYRGRQDRISFRTTRANKQWRTKRTAESNRCA